MRCRMVVSVGQVFSRETKMEGGQGHHRVTAAYSTWLLLHFKFL